MEVGSCARWKGRSPGTRSPQALDAALEQAQAGNGQVVGIVAEAGTGKSRLCFEFLERCRARGMSVLVGRAVAHGKNIPYLPMLEVFRPRTLPGTVAVKPGASAGRGRPRLGELLN